MHLIEITNGFRAWGSAALLFGMPLIADFVNFAFRRARDAWNEFDGPFPQRLARFAGAAWHAGREAEFRVNTWITVALLLFAGIGGGSIYISSNFMGGYSTQFLNSAMLALWAMLTAAGWSVVVLERVTPKAQRRTALAAGVLLAVMIYAAMHLEAEA